MGGITASETRPIMKPVCVEREDPPSATDILKLSELPETETYFKDGPAPVPELVQFPELTHNWSTTPPVIPPTTPPVSDVPIPGAFWLMAAGLLAFAWSRKQCRK